ncbi:hypothetical protein, partial [Anabaena sp. CA = ATCC 33047]|uniref:hypothetical protein n=1 Tax=Anabaena sp. (strain CA / ATCC 33047) TaxID=52271 RepID=UPI000AB10E06
VQTGTLNLQGGGTSSGIFEVDSSASLVFGGGTYSLTGGSVITDNLISAATILLTGANIRGASVSDAFNNVTISGGSLTLNQTVSAINNLAVSNNGSLTFDETVNSISNLTLSGGTLAFNGTTA